MVQNAMQQMQQGGPGGMPDMAAMQQGITAMQQQAGPG